MNNLKTSVKSSAKNLAVQTARLIANEPLEILKMAPGQLIGSPETSKENQNKSNKTDNDNDPKKNDELLEKDRQRSARLRSAYEAELKDLVREKKFREYLEKAQRGEEFSFDDPILTWEQREVLRAQKMAIQAMIEKPATQNRPLIEPVAKRARNLFAGMKTGLERQKRKSEIRMPPSG